MATTPTDDPLANSDRTVGVHVRVLDQGVEDVVKHVCKSLKREALLFDQIAIPNFSELWNSSRPAHPVDASIIKELDWLLDIGLVRHVHPNIATHPAVLRQYLNAIVAETGEPLDVMTIPDAVSMANLVGRRLVKVIGLRSIEMDGRMSFEESTKRKPRVADAVFARIFSINLRAEGINAFPILETRRQMGDVFPSGTTPVLEVVLKSMPMPDDQTAWQDIIEFRSDPESMQRLRRLRVWVRKFAHTTTATSLAEMKEEIEVLLDEYEEHMKLHQMKVNKGATETLITVVGKVAEDFVKLKWGELAKLPFILRERKLSLVEAELKAPNRELAFISMARDRFSK